MVEVEPLIQINFGLLVEPPIRQSVDSF